MYRIVLKRKHNSDDINNNSKKGFNWGKTVQITGMSILYMHSKHIEKYDVSFVFSYRVNR